MRLLKGLPAAMLTSTLLTAGVLANEAPLPPARGLGVDQGHFVFDGKPFRIVSGEMHYPRIPREYWHERLKMAKAMGLNAVTAYVFWNVHERTPGQYDFGGQYDVAEFIRAAQAEGLYVILRPGPYVCAEWEFGGFPAWLLKDRSTIVRSRDPKYLEPATRWLHRLGKELAPLQYAHGGPIIAVQVENEYGSFDADHAYMEDVRRALIDGGFDRTLLYTADGGDYVTNGSLPDLPVAINFGTGDAQKEFAKLHKLRPQGPFMNGEYWDGWFDHWGDKHNTPDANKQIADVEWMLEQGYSLSLYMFHGGTSFGWMNGANWDKGEYQPDVTSYDYDVGLDESGRPTPKYFAFRDVIAKATGVTPPPIPPAAPTQAIGAVALPESASLWDNLPAPVESRDLKTMEDLDQAYGYILYRTTLAAAGGDLVLDGLHDYARIYVDGKLAGTLDRRLKQSKLAITARKGSVLDILVENSGRINFSKELRGERKGITGSASLRGAKLNDWKIYSLPLDNVANYRYASKPCSAAPCFYRGRFDAPKSGNASADTFLDTAGWNKGFVWLNGKALGRHWDVGPQRTLYVPGVWLTPKGNDVIALDLGGVKQAGVTLRDKPVLDAKPASAAR
ncbi:glycoside hydrolase family 35 protein [Rudaea cellulosilytica]|uniref:glycoside hydrolase family 35 protein n=1 Tax=Rudaea cellulosilytica TaxID=540746 RepID=UPI00039D9F42|nr:glycoside hydrolase family 35 protein [Rudaea cellulosilytica]